MKCQSCGKKEATVRYKENINGKKQEFNFCYDCAQKLGFVQFSNVFSPMFMNIPNYFLEEENSCPTCGYTLENYTNTGLFGCPDCFEAFQNELDEMLLKLQGVNRHVKINDKIVELDELTKPIKVKKKEESKSSGNNQLDSLKAKLKELVANEEYEEAAKIRDKIKKLENK